MSTGVLWALGSVAAIAVTPLIRERGSFAKKEAVFDGITLEMDEVILDGAENAWNTYAPLYLGRTFATEAPTRAHYRSLANRLQEAARRTKPRSEFDRTTLARWERAVSLLQQVADAADGFRGGRLPSRPRELNPGDRVRVVGRVPFAKMETGRVYEVHLTPTQGGARMIGFRLVDALDRSSKHTIGPFRAAAVEAMVKPMDYVGIAGALVTERIAPLDLEG